MALDIQLELGLEYNNCSFYVANHFIVDVHDEGCMDFILFYFFHFIINLNWDTRHFTTV